MDDLHQSISDALHSLMSSAVRGIGRAVRPVYYATGSGRPDHLGSCILLNTGSKRILLTAAHVIDENKVASLYIPVNGTLQRLEGSGIITVAPKGKRDDDHYDFAALDLPPKLANSLGAVRYVEPHEIQMTIASRKPHMALGFPTSKNRKRIDHQSRRVNPQRFSHGGPLWLPNMGETAEYLEPHLLRLIYEKQSRAFDGSIVNSIGPKGLSGGGLFCLGQIDTTGTPQEEAKLAGVLIEKRRGEKSILATDISLVLDMLEAPVGP
ncbi:hypothetical protein [Bradyrhizobium stylosanthis]|uniref:hypothetical protein n=1 Tax=Bradyrhizobium stylosanthis TaxID=1803665 RepID=UPI000ABB7373|nr:hypothetical protein [Bradyrhizobium stylosanthis]